MLRALLILLVPAAAWAQLPLLGGNGGTSSGSSGGGPQTTSCSAPTYNAGGTTTLVFSGAQGCAAISATGATTLAFTGTTGFGPYFLTVTNTVPTASPFTYPGAVVGVCQPDASSTNAVSVIEFELIGTSYYPVSCTSATAAGLTLGQIYASNGSTGPPVAATSANAAALWTGTGCGTTTNVPQLNGNCTSAGGTTTLTRAFIDVTPGFYSNSSTAQNSGVIYCYDFNAPLPVTLGNAYSYIQSNVSGVFGVAIYSSTGSLLTATTQTGTSTGTAVPVSVALGGGSAVFSSGSAGRLSACVTSNAGPTMTFKSVDGSEIGAIQNSSDPIIYTGAAGNPATFVGSTITWPSSLGIKVALSSANFPKILLTP